MRGEHLRPIVIAAGGTGGHFFPAEALAETLLRRGHRVALMTDARSAGLASPAFSGGERFVLAGAGVAGRGVARGARAFAAMGLGAAQAWRILARLDPVAVVGFGGYPCVAPVLGANLLRQRPAIVLHEQNGVLGRANRLLSRRCDLLALSQAGTARVPDGVATLVVGNPVREAVAALAGVAYSPPGDRIDLLVLGGSLGARVFSDIVPPALALLPPGVRQRLRVVQQCRAEDLDRVRAAYAGAIEAELAPFFPDVAARLGTAHLVIARAGASTVAELAIAGRPSILVPLPNAIDDHQAANAQVLAKVGAAWMMPQRTCDAPALAARIAELVAHPAMLQAAARAAARQAHADAAAALADATLELIARRTRERAA